MLLNPDLDKSAVNKNPIVKDGLIDDFQSLEFDIGLMSE